MLNASINAILGLQIKHRILKKKYFLAALLIGIMIPEFDFIIEYIISIILNFDFLFENKWSLSNSIFHSILMIPIISLLIMIYSELKNKDLINVALGVSIGMVIHIVFDIITLRTVGIFSPFFMDAPLNLNRYFNIEVPENIKKLVHIFDFLLFRVYAWLLINKIIKNPSENERMITPINIWMKIQLYIFLFLLLLIYYFGVSNAIFANMLGVLYSATLLIAMYFTFKIRNTIS